MPFPANYGGVIDVYYKLVWLKKQGIAVHLHCFSYGRKPSAELEALCASVHYYHRKTGLLSNLSLLPYTVRSRRDAALKNNLLRNDHPILFEVLHTCGLMRDPALAGRKKIYRHSNIEHEYYSGLAATERSFLRRLYLSVEAWKLRRFEKVLKHADLILPVNEKDTLYFQKKYPEVEALYLPSFHDAEETSIVPGKGDYILFHGNLSVSENYEAASWLVENVFSKLALKVVVAGLNPPEFLRRLIAGHPHISLVANPAEEEMSDLIQGAQVHVLYTGQPTGLKLKLLNVLYKGRFIVCNEKMLSGTGLKSGNALMVADTAGEYLDAVQRLMTAELTGAHIEERKKQLERFSNRSNVQKLINAIFHQS